MVEYEEGFDLEVSNYGGSQNVSTLKVCVLQYPDIVAGLTQIGHESKSTPTADGFSAVVSVSAHEDIQGAYDSRRGGYISYMTSWTVQTGFVDGDMLRASQNKVQLRKCDCNYLVYMSMVLVLALCGASRANKTLFGKTIILPAVKFILISIKISYVYSRKKEK